jgi:nitroimidazol reductase NimA-like FMN-containing flavoprotein (pyridoxamine 5'-phosphate oxidase superfamily)
MRRKDREITDPAEIETLLRKTAVCRVAMTDGKDPYVVPLCFGYEDGSIYFHSAKEGKKITLLAANPRCCIEVDDSGGPITDTNPCSWEFRYKSVICTGIAQFLEDPEEKRKGLNCIMQHYGGAEYPFADKDIDRVCVVRIVIGEMTGKKYGY